jgi:large exoprotein involved in heme utilization and adhesion
MNQTISSAKTAEIAAGQPLRRNTLALAVAAALSGPGALYAQNLPTGLTPTSGSFSSSTNAAGTAMNINQSTQNAAGTATTFSIGQGHRVDITQPSTQSILMVNVLGNNVSSIRGSLTANGQFWLVTRPALCSAPPRAWTSAACGHDPAGELR